MERLFTPQNPHKYRGNNLHRIILRSSWELKFAVYCDRNTDILEWSSETVIVPYVCPTDNLSHRYFVDFLIKVRQSTGGTKTFLIEIKPERQTRPPTNKKSKYYAVEVATYMKNEAKWKHAKAYADAKGWEFQIFTEKTLGL